MPGTIQNVLENGGPQKYYRNYCLCQGMVSFNMIDTIGHGIEKVFSEQKRRKCFLPEYVTDGHEVKIVFRKKYTKDSDESKNVNVGSTVGSGGSLTVVQLTERQQKIVKLIKGNPLISSQQMSVVLSVVKRTIERDLAELQKKGVLRREGNTNAGKWVLLNTIKESFG